MNRQVRSTFWLTLACVCQTGCSILTPIPLWELAKATGSTVSGALPYAGSQASNTVYHLHPAVKELCIEFNPKASVADIVPALQIELKRHQVESRVYDVGTVTDACTVWLRYTAVIAWDMPPYGSDYKSYVKTAALTLRSADGVVLSSSNYVLDSAFDVGKWASTQRKLAPVVTALLTGFEK